MLPSERNDIVQSLYAVASVLYRQNHINEPSKYFIEALTFENIDFDLNGRVSLLKIKLMWFIIAKSGYIGYMNEDDRGKIVIK